MAYVLRESYTPSAITDFDSAKGPNQSQIFTAVSTHNVDRIDIKLKKSFGAPNRTFGVYLYSTLVGVPHVQLAQFGSFDQIDLTLDYVEYSFTDTSYAVTSGTQYAIVSLTAEEVTSSWVAWATNTSNGYAGGVYDYNNYILGWFTNSPNNDRWFKTYEESGAVVYAEGTKTVAAAAVVDYITGPGKSWNPGPTDDQEDIAIIGRTAINTLTWNTPTNETPDFLVYYRAQGGAWVLQETITDDSTSYTLSPAILSALSYYSVYEWRIDTSEAGLTTTGDTWTFITQQSGDYTDYTRRSDYNADQVWQPGTGWVDPNTFEFAGGGSYKERVVVVGHQVIYFGDL